MDSPAPRRPHVDAARVICRAEDQFWCTVVARANVTHVGLALHQNLGRAEVAKFEHVRVRVNEQILLMG